MASFGKESQKQVDTCERRLQLVLAVAIKIMDFSAIVGHRGKEDQDKAFRDKKSKLKWPESKHNSLPSLAIDVAPYPIDFSNKPKAVARFYLLAGVILTVAWFMRVGLRCGFDWDGDFDLLDQNFDDLGHFELED
jgi:peptidoglycan L-alanyl-D-glutamate endopeptidase CwlK